MKRLLFVGQSLKVGGIERALVEQLSVLDNSKYCVDLFLFSKSGAYLPLVSPNINVLEPPFLLHCAALTNDEAKKRLSTFIVRSFLYFCSKIMGNRRLYSLLFMSVRRLKGYDVAISYFHDGGPSGLYYGCNLFVLRKVDAIKRVAWIHSDPFMMDACSKDNRAFYSKFDVIVNVSFTMKRKFDALNVVNENRSKVVYNRCRVNEIEELSQAYLAPDIGRIQIVTVGRLERNKSTMELLAIAKRLKENNRQFVWYFIGKGGLQESASSFIRSNGLSGDIVFTGELANPYPYILKADICVSGSVVETFGLSILEAILLNTPVVALRYEAIEEIIKDSINGMIADTFEDLFIKLSELLVDNHLLQAMKEKAHPLYDYNRLNHTQFKQVVE